MCFLYCIWLFWRQSARPSGLIRSVFPVIRTHPFTVSFIFDQKRCFTHVPYFANEVCKSRFQQIGRMREGKLEIFKERGNTKKLLFGLIEEICFFPLPSCLLRCLATCLWLFWVLLFLGRASVRQWFATDAEQNAQIRGLLWRPAKMTGSWPPVSASPRLCLVLKTNLLQMATVSSRRLLLLDCYAANNRAWGPRFSLSGKSLFLPHPSRPNSIPPFTSDFKSSFSASSLP